MSCKPVSCVVFEARVIEFKGIACVVFEASLIEFKDVAKFRMFDSSRTTLFCDFHNWSCQILFYAKSYNTSHSRHFYILPMLQRCFLHYTELELRYSNPTMPREIQRTITNWCNIRIVRMCSICDEPRPCKVDAQVDSEKTKTFIHLTSRCILKHDTYNFLRISYYEDIY